MEKETDGGDNEEEEEEEEKKKGKCMGKERMKGRTKLISKYEEKEEEEEAKLKES